MTDISLRGRSAIVTGAGRGIGKAHALEFAKRGAAVLVNDIDPDLASQVADEIIAAGGRATSCSDSVAGPEGANQIVKTAVGEFGSVDILVNNAGVLRTGYFTDLTEEQIDVVLMTHLRAAFTLTRLVWPLMSEQGYGRVVMTSSSSGLLSHQGLSNYAAAKAGLYGLTKALAFEGEARGIKVNAILPMAVSVSPAKDPIPDMERYRALYSSGIPPVEDWRGDTSTISALVAYLCSDNCPYTGEAFSACNGRYARVFVGVADGWIASACEEITAENIAAHIDEIRDLSSYTVPKWLFEEVRDVSARIATLVQE